MGQLENGGNPTYSGLPSPYYIQITAAWQLIPFPSSIAKGGNNPQPAHVNGRRRFILATQPVWISSDPAGANAWPVPASIQYETTTRSALYVKAATAPFDPNPATSSSSVTTSATNSSSSLSAVPTSGFSSSSSSASPYSSSSNVPVPVYTSSSSTGVISTFGFLFGAEEGT